jgi:hypothetical protein
LGIERRGGRGNGEEVDGTEETFGKTDVWGIGTAVVGGTVVSGGGPVVVTGEVEVSGIGTAVVGGTVVSGEGPEETGASEMQLTLKISATSKI